MQAKVAIYPIAMPSQYHALLLWIPRGRSSFTAANAQLNQVSICGFVRQHWLGEESLIQFTMLIWKALSYRRSYLRTCQVCCCHQNCCHQTCLQTDCQSHCQTPTIVKEKASAASLKPLPPSKSSFMFEQPNNVQPGLTNPCIPA